MTALPVVWLPALLAVVIAASPVLASWIATLETGSAWRWWQPRNVTPTLALAVAALAIALTIPGIAAGAPWLAWTAFAVGGAVLMTVDERTHLLPARFLHPLTGVVGAILIATACLTDGASSLVRSAAAGVIVGLIWLAVALVVPAAIGLGDVRLFALNAVLLGWLSWPAVLAGQLLTFLLAPVAALAARAMGRTNRMDSGNVPMGPPAIVATVLIGLILHT